MKNRTVLCSLIIVLLACATVSAQSTTPLPFPRIVSTVELTGQTGSIPTTTLFTPKANGTFRFTGTMGITMGNQCQDGCTWGMTIGFTTDSGPLMIPFIGINAAVVSGGTGNQQILRDNAGQPLTYSVACTQGDRSGSVYEVFITVEQIQ